MEQLACNVESKTRQKLADVPVDGIRTMYVFFIVIAVAVAILRGT
jgi:hypothetical protein